jgi:hypothetical protein
MDDVTKTMIDMGKQMDRWRELVKEIKQADLHARAARAEADVAESAAFLRAEGSMDVRKHESRVNDTVVRLKTAADVAEVEYQHLRRAIDGCRAMIDVLRSQGSYQKAELATLGSTPDTW